MPETNARIKVCHDTAANFKTNNPTLLVGEWALETDTKKMKIGDGSTAYNALPYSTAEDSDEWRKPDDWVDIRSGALDNSIYLLVGHSADYTTYPKCRFSALLSTSANTYDVYIDGIKRYTTAHNTSTEIDFQTLALDSGYDVTYPASLRTHIIRITPTVSTDTLTRFRMTSVSGQNQQGVLWAHYQLSNSITMANAFATENTDVRCGVLEAITAKNDNITCTTGSTATSSGLYLAFKECSSLVKVPTFTASSNQYNFGIFQTLWNVPAKKIVIKNNKGVESMGLINRFQGQIVDVENGVAFGTSTATGNDGNGAVNLKKLPALSQTTQSENLQVYDIPSLQDTVLDDSANSARKLFSFHGSSSSPCNGLKGLTVSPEAPFDSATSPQLNVSYTGMNRAALVNLFKSMPVYFNDYTVVGSPTIQNKVASNFSTDNYITVDSSGWAVLENIGDNNRLFLKANIPSGTTGRHYLFGSTNWSIFVKDGVLHAYLRSGTYDLTASDIQYGTDIWIRVQVQRTNSTGAAAAHLAIKYSAEDEYVIVASNSGSGMGSMAFSATSYIGVSSSIAAPFDGSIDLKGYAFYHNYAKVWGLGINKATCSVVGCTGTSDLTAEDKAIAEDKGWALTLS